MTISASTPTTCRNPSQHFVHEASRREIYPPRINMIRGGHCGCVRAVWMICALVVTGREVQRVAFCKKRKKRLSNDAAPNPDQADAEPHLISTTDQEPCDIVHVGINADVHYMYVHIRTTLHLS